MLEHMESDMPASKLLSRALEVWAKGYQVIPMTDDEKPADWQTWLNQRQTQEDMELLFLAHPEATGIGIVVVSSFCSPVVVDIGWPNGKSLLSSQDIRLTQVQGDDGIVEWQDTGKFEFFEQLKNLRKTREAAIREAKAAEEELKPTISLPVTKIGEGDLNRLFADPDAMRMIAPVLGIPKHRAEGEGFRCVLHQEKHPSAHLFQDDKGHYMYACFHGYDRGFRPLPEVYYVQKTGNKTEKLKGPTFAVWALRLLAEAGVLQPLDDVGLPELKAKVTDGVRKVYDGLRLLYSVRWTYSYGDAAPVSWRFAAEWCDVSQATAGKAMHELLRLGIIHSAGKHKKTMLFLPGRGKRVVRVLPVNAGRGA